MTANRSKVTAQSKSSTSNSQITISEDARRPAEGEMRTHAQPDPNTPMGEFLNINSNLQRSCQTSNAQEPAMKITKLTFTTDERRIIIEKRAEQKRRCGEPIPKPDSTRRWILRNPDEALELLRSSETPADTADLLTVENAVLLGEDRLQQPVEMAHVSSEHAIHLNPQEVADVMSERHESQQQTP